MPRFTCYSSYVLFSHTHLDTIILCTFGRRSHYVCYHWTLRTLLCTDDLVFFIYIYQRWHYAVDYSRPTIGHDGEEEDDDDEAAADSALVSAALVNTATKATPPPTSVGGAAEGTAEGTGTGTGTGMVGEATKLLRFYNTHITGDPTLLQQQLAKVPSLVAKYESDYPKMWRILEKKYVVGGKGTAAGMLHRTSATRGDFAVQSAGGAAGGVKGKTSKKND